MGVDVLVTIVLKTQGSENLQICVTSFINAPPQGVQRATCTPKPKKLFN